MTSPAGGGAANLGTVTGKVRINYESTNAAAAVRQAENFQSTLQDVGRTATKSAREVARAGGTISQFGRMMDRLGQRAVPNPAAGLGTRVENEANRATKALASLQRSAGKPINVNTAVKVSPNRVELDRGAIERAMRGSLLNQIRITAPVKIAPSAVELDRRAIETVVQNARMSAVTIRVPIRVEPTDVQVNRGSIDRAVGAASANVGSAGGAGDAGGGLAGVVPMLGRITTGAGIAAVAVGGVATVLTKGFSRLSQIDDATVKLSAMGKSMEEIKQISASSLKSVEGTAFGLNEAFNTAADAINAGVKPGKELDQYLQATANTASLAGAGMQELGTAFSRAAIQGKLTGEIFQILSDRQVPVLKLLADEYDVTQQKAQSMISNGEVDFDRFINAMSKTGGAAKAMGNTITGSLKNLGASVSRLGANLLAPLFGKKNADDANTIALAVQKVTEGVNWLGKTVKDNIGGVISFWEAIGKGGIMAAKGIVGVAGFISDAIVKIVETFGKGTDAFGDIADFFGADGVADNAHRFSDEIANMGKNLRETRDINMGKLNRALDEGYANIEDWAAAAREAAANSGNLGDSTEDLTAKYIDLKDALEAMEIKAETAEAALMGTNAQFKEFLEQVKDKGGTESLLNTLTQVRERFENGGRQVKNFADAIDKMKDSTASASDKADALISSLQGLGLLPGGDALSSYNEEFDKMTSYMSDIIDLADTTGDALANVDGTLNLNTGNGRAVLDQIEAIRQKMVALAASGEASPEEAYDRTVQGLNQLLQGQAGISPEVAQRIIDTYLPKGTILESIKAQDPKAALESIFKDDPAKLQTELNLLTSVEDILGQLVGPDGKLHIPTVLETGGPGAGPPATPPGPPPAVGPSAIPAPPTGPTITAKPGEDPTRPLSPERRRELGIPDSVPPVYPAPVPGQNKPNQPGLTAPPVGPPATPPAGTITPNNLQGLLGDTPDSSEQNKQQFIELANNKEALDKALAENPEIAKSLQGLVDQANSQGENMGVAFAQGLISGSEEVKKALLELATMAGDYLGNSPAKYGPLSGKGWTLERGKTFTSDWAKGIQSMSNEAAGAVEGVANAAVGGFGSAGGMGSGVTLNDQVAQGLKDMQELSDFGKHLLEFGNQIADIAFGVAKFANDMSGGRLFPKTYTQDPEWDGRRGSSLGGWNPRGWKPPGQSTENAPMPVSGQTSGGGGKAVPLVQNPDGTWTSPDPEWAKLIKRESGGRNIGQQITDANGGPGSPNAAQGIFQITPETWRGNGGSAFAPTPLEATPEQQAIVAANIFNARGGQPWGSGKGQNFGRENEDLLRAGLNGAPAQPAPPAPPVSGSLTPPPIAPPTPTKGSSFYSEWYPATGSTSEAMPQEVGKYDYRDLIGTKWVPGKGWTKEDGTVAQPKQAGDNQDTPAPASPQRGLTLPSGGSQNTNAAIGLLEQYANSLGLQLTSGKRTNAMTASGKSWHLSGEAGDFAVPGVNVPTENKRAFAEYVRDNFAPYIKELIYSDDQGGVNLYDGKPHQYSASTLSDHRNHVHVAIRDQVIEALAQGVDPSTLTPLNASQTGAQPTPVSLTGQPAQALTGIFDNTRGLPSMPGQLQDLAANDPVLQNAMQNQASLTKDSVVPVLQHLDGLIAEQTKLQTPEGKAKADALGGYKNQLQGQFGLQEGPSQLDQAMGIVSGISGIASDVFGMIDQGLKVVAATQDIGNTLVRGIANTKDVEKTIDNVQEFITLAAKGWQMAGNITSFAGQFTGGQDYGATQAAGQLMSLVGQAISAVNTGIDIAQEAYGIVTKYGARFTQSILGLSGSSDVRFLLDEMTGQVQAYSSDNPQQRTTLNTLGRQLGAEYPERQGVTNYNTIYAGPGQDPRDTMSDMMFAVRSSGVGALSGNDL